MAHLKKKQFRFFLTGKAQSDSIEKRFGKVRQMTGGNLYASVRQFLESDRIIRIKNLSKIDLSLSEIRDIFGESREKHSKEEEEIAIAIFKVLVPQVSVDVTEQVPKNEANLLFYVSGHFARSIAQKTSCQLCKALLFVASHKYDVRNPEEEQFKHFF